MIIAVSSPVIEPLSFPSRPLKNSSRTYEMMDSSSARGKKKSKAKTISDPFDFWKIEEGTATASDISNYESYEYVIDSSRPGTSGIWVRMVEH
jgi:hypothetical protein